MEDLQRLLLENSTLLFFTFLIYSIKDFNLKI